MNTIDRCIRDFAAAALTAMHLALVCMAVCGLAASGCTITHIHRFEFDTPKTPTTQAATPFATFVEQLTDEPPEK